MRKKRNAGDRVADAMAHDDETKAALANIHESLRGAAVIEDYLAGAVATFLIAHKRPVSGFVDRLRERLASIESAQRELYQKERP